MDRTKKVLVALLVLGALATVGVGTYATFNAQTTNPNNGFTTGTLVLSDKQTTTCFSAGATAQIANNNVNSACDSVAFLALGKPGDAGTANFTLKNEGSINGATGLTLQASNCADTHVGAYYADPTGNPLCGALGVQVQDYTDNTFTTPVANHCVYPASSTQTCAAQGTFGTLGGLAASATTVKAPLNAGSSVFEQLTVSLPSATGNGVQGLQSSFNLNWVLTQ